MADSLFTSQVPSNGDVDDGVQQTLGTVWKSDIAGLVTHGRWYFPATPIAGTVDWVLYTIAGVEVARATFESMLAGQWNEVALATPYAYEVPNTPMVACIVTPNRYVATNSFFNVSDLESGHLTAPATGNIAGGNGRFANGDTFPTSTFSGGCYFPDLVFDTGPAGQTISLAFIGSSATVPQPALIPGPVAVQLPLIASTAVVYQPRLETTHSQNVDVPLIESTSRVYGIRITGGTRMAPLIPVADVETILGRPLTDAEAAQVGIFIDFASSYIREYTGRSFERRSNHAVRMQADSHGVIELPDPPIISVASIVDTDADGEEWDAGDAWDGMWRLTGLRPWHTYTVTYTHGYEEVPDSIRGVCASMASRQIINPAGIRQETVGATSVTYASVFGEAGALGLSGLEKQILDMYADLGQSWRL